MNEPDDLQRKLGEIGERYLKRTLAELTRLRELIGAVRASEPDSLKEIERVAHKICGSGSMFGFDAVSERARALELCAAQDAGAPDLPARLEALTAALDTQVQAAAQARGIR